jgi:hypothetical protein
MIAPKRKEKVSSSHVKKESREPKTAYSGLRPISLMKNLPKMKFKSIRKTRKRTEVSSMRTGFRVSLKKNQYIKYIRGKNRSGLERIRAKLRLLGIKD